MYIKVTAFTETKKLHYTRISAHVFVFIVFAEEGNRLVDVYVNSLTCITDMYIIVNGYYIWVLGVIWLASKVTLWIKFCTFYIPAVLDHISHYMFVEFSVQKLTKFKVIFDLFIVCVYFIQQQNCKLYYIYLMIVSEIQSEIGHYSCDSEKIQSTRRF